MHCFFFRFSFFFYADPKYLLPYLQKKTEKEKTEKEKKKVEEEKAE